VKHVALALEKAVNVVDQIARDLLNPCAVRLADHAGDVDAARFEVDHEQHDVANESCEREDLDGEEVGRRDHAEVGLEEGLPRRRALGRWCKSVVGEDALDRVSSELVTEVAERAAEPGVAPGRVFDCELDHQAVQRSGRAGSCASSSGRAVVLVRDEFAVPAQNRIGRHQAAELVQNAATEGFALRREPAALGVGEAQAPAAELLAQHAVLLLEKLDDLELAAVHPAREHEQ